MHARKLIRSGDSPLRASDFSRGVIFTPARVSTIPEEKWMITRSPISRLTCDDDRNCTLGNGALSYEPCPFLNQEEDSSPQNMDGGSRGKTCSMAVLRLLLKLSRQI